MCYKLGTQSGTVEVMETLGGDALQAVASTYLKSQQVANMDGSPPHPPTVKEHFLVLPWL